MKKLLYLIFAALLLIIIGFGALFFLIDPNQLKPTIADQVKKATGRELVISGDMSWKIFPRIGFSLGETTLQSPPGFAENFVQFSNAELDLALMPLLSHRLEIGNINLKNAHIFIQTLADGRSNMDGMITGKKEAEEKQSTSAETAEKAPWDIILQGISLTNASATIRNDKTGDLKTMSKLNFSLDHFSPGEWSKISFSLSATSNEITVSSSGQTGIFIAADLGEVKLKKLHLETSATTPEIQIESVRIDLDQFTVGQDGNLTFSIKGKKRDLDFASKGSTKIKSDRAFNQLQVTGLQVETNLKGDALPKKKLNLILKADSNYNVEQSLLTIPSLEADIEQMIIKGKASFKDGRVRQIRFNMSSESIDIDQLLGMNKAKPAAKPSQTGPEVKATISDQEPDLSALKQLDLIGTLAVDKFKARGVHVTDVLINLKIQKGIAEISSLAANLYKGSIKARVKINSNNRPATYLAKKEIVGVDARPLLMDLADIKMLEGKAKVSIDVAGRGLSQKKIRSNIKGTVDLQFADGAIHGVNIPKMLREAAAILKGEVITEKEQGELKTDFSSMGMTLTLAKGVAKTNNLKLISPLFIVKGAGETNLVKEDLNFLLKTALAKELQGQEAEELRSLRGLEIPIKITGTWQMPKFSLSLEEIAKEKAKQEIKRGLEEIFGKEKEGEPVSPERKILQNLFN
ncbi:AsmA family protein [Desulfotalea psychrophila]|uniref:Related to periplasmic protein (AsmA) n=1 Tax=Desulfotalea psychrophila (strain LSv54 / DSM 12343) TaxID=177439 RepID=Q6AS52_DESPS|nr:AsmA family protein [Desulfotalea psychrophila]CAG34823.1 related to periplasmic protein (AsmA) [Desulfotalea psychrophila LSv54]